MADETTITIETTDDPPTPPADPTPAPSATDGLLALSETVGRLSADMETLRETVTRAEAQSQATGGELQAIRDMVQGIESRLSVAVEEVIEEATEPEPETVEEIPVEPIPQADGDAGDAEPQKARGWIAKLFLG